MLAAQCNKITTKASPHDTAGKSFLPWKKQPPGAPPAGHLHHHIASQRMCGLNTPALSMPNNLSYPPVTSSAVSSYPNELFYSGAGGPSQCSELAQSALLHKMHSENGHPSFGAVYSRVPSAAYDPSWHFTNIPSTHPGASHALKHNGITHMAGGGGGAPWWEVHPASNVHSTGSNWLSESSALHGQIASPYPAPDYHIGHPLASNPALLSSQQHLQDTYKSMLQPAQTDLGNNTTYLPRPSLPGLSSPRNSRRYTGRATCDCPNCHEIDRLG
ncbi:unnamed protein product, partial [Lymnaea stagnalis]